MALPFGISGILSLVVSQVYLPAASLFALLLLVLGLFLVCGFNSFLVLFLYGAMAVDARSTTTASIELNLRCVNSLAISFSGKYTHYLFVSKGKAKKKTLKT